MAIGCVVKVFLLLALWSPVVQGKRFEWLTESYCTNELNGTLEPFSDFVERLDTAYGDCSIYSLPPRVCNHYRQHAIKTADQTSDGMFLCNSDRRKMWHFRNYAKHVPLSRFVADKVATDEDPLPPTSEPVGIDLRRLTNSTVQGGPDAGEAVQTTDATDDAKMRACKLQPSYKPESVAFMQCANYICSRYGQLPTEREGLHKRCCRSFGFTGPAEHLCWYYPLKEVLLQ